MSKDRCGRTEGVGTAMSADKKIRFRSVDDITADELEALAQEVKRIEREHSDAIEFLIPIAVECAERGVRFSVHERLDWRSWHGLGSVDHDCYPVLARILVERVPQCRPYVEVRRSRWDGVFERRASRGA